MKYYKNEINASSMADIAFLLLIFFLVTTTIDQDKGILSKLPIDSIEETQPVIDRNVLELSINALGEIMIEGEISKVSKIPYYVKNHILNYGKSAVFSDNPKNAVVLLESDRGVSYDLFVQVQDKLRAVYAEIRNQESLKLTNGAYSYSALKICIEKGEKESAFCKEYRAIIKSEFPMVLIEK